MMPIDRLLARIRWDAEFGRAAFVIGYYERVRDTIVRVPLRQVHFEPRAQAAFTAVEDDGSVHEVPLHRVREVYRNGELIWQRPARDPGGAHSSAGSR